MRHVVVDNMRKNRVHLMWPKPHDNSICQVAPFVQARRRWPVRSPASVSIGPFSSSVVGHFEAQDIRNTDPILKRAEDGSPAFGADIVVIMKKDELSAQSNKTEMSWAGEGCHREKPCNLRTSCRRAVIPLQSVCQHRLCVWCLSCGFSGCGLRVQRVRPCEQLIKHFGGGNEVPTKLFYKHHEKNISLRERWSVFYRKLG